VETDEKVVMLSPSSGWPKSSSHPVTRR